MILYPYQKVAASWLSTKSSALLADDMGLGKSVELLTAADLAARKRIVVVCPAVACMHWMDEIKRWYPSYARMRVQGRSKPLASLLSQALLFDQPKVIVLNYDILKAYALPLAKWADLLILDESHYVKTPTAQRTKAAKLVATGVQSRNGAVWLASGTPMPNRPSDLIGQLDIMNRLRELGGKEHYERRYCDAKRRYIYVNGMRRAIWDTSGASNLSELRTNLEGHVMLRRMRKEVLPDLTVMPPYLYSLDIPSDARYREYQSAENDLISYVYQRALELAQSNDPTSEAAKVAAKALAAQHLVELANLRRIIGMCKVKPTIEWVKQWREGGEHGRKLVLFAHHRTVTDALGKAFPNSASILGGMEAGLRAKEIDRFRTDPTCSLLVASTVAGGIAVNLTPCSDVAFVEYEWTSAAHRQATDRVARHGQTNVVSVAYLTAPGTVDERMAEHIANQMRVVDAVFGDENDVAEDVMGGFLAMGGGAS